MDLRRQQKRILERHAANERAEKADSCWSSNKDRDMAAPVSKLNLQRFLPYLFLDPVLIIYYGVHK